MIKVAIVDDHDLVRTGIKHMLEATPGIKIVGEASSGEEAINLVRDHMPNVVIMDLKMPGIGGLEATRKLLRIDPDIKILIVTSSNDEIYPSRLLQAGAAGYMTKGASMDELIKAIRSVNAGQRYITPDIASQLALRSVEEKSESIFDALSQRELQVMTMIIKGGKAQEISEQLFLSPKTVNSYRYRIFEKLKVKNDVELTLLAIKHGLIDAPEGQN